MHARHVQPSGLARGLGAAGNSSEFTLASRETEQPSQKEQKT
jgi:hypothetical protein